MKISILSTEHSIADTVARYLVTGFGQYVPSDIAIGYGILRGMDKSLRRHEHWFNVDNGYFNPGHFNGYYRISYKGTQAKYDPDYPAPDFDIDLKPIKTDGEYILICPPTEHVCQFFDIDYNEWMQEAFRKVYKSDYRIRTKDCKISLEQHLSKAKCVLTFNSSVGWEALINGIPCLSDTQHSVVGSYYNTKSIDECIKLFNTVPRKPLLNFMRAHQFKLDEIARGDAWELIKHYTSGSGMTAGKRLDQMLQPTP